MATSSKPSPRRWLVGAGALAAAALAVGLGVEGLGAVASAKDERPPNIVIILADDLGHYDISANGSPWVKTPNIDSIARDGVRFESGYSGDAVCSTSRAAMLTGRFPSRYGFEYLPGAPGVVDAITTANPEQKYPDMVTGDDDLSVPATARGLPDSEITLATALKAQGYHTGLVGKWHLGGAPNFNPTRHGFDEFTGFLGGASLYGDPGDPQIVTFKQPWLNTDAFIYKTMKSTYLLAGKPAKATYLTYDLTNAAVDYIGRNKAGPFFLYLAFNAPHVPKQAPKAVYDRMDYIKDPGLRTHYAMIAALDDSIGQVLDKLKAEGLDKNTIVVFTSDNGGPDYIRNPYQNLPFRGWKLTYFEGGFNVPYFIRWPGRVKPGTTIHGVASSLDLFPTLLKAAGGKLPTDREYDGVDLAPAITGRDPDALDNRTLYWRKEDYRAVRSGDWKLQTSKHPQKTWLFNLKIDPTERFNLAAQHPDKVRELQALYAAHETRFRKPIWAAQTRTRVDIDGWSPDSPDAIDYIYWAN